MLQGLSKKPTEAKTGSQVYVTGCISAEYIQNFRRIT